MLRVLKNRTFRHLFAAQVVALLGTGLATVALGLLAWDLAGENAGQVLGTALAIKMIAYVTLSPVAAAAVARLPRRAVLITLDLARAAIALCLPFVSEVWQVYVLIFLLQSASAAFTPAFQATIPDVLPDEDDYTDALALSRLAYDLENLLSPALAALLLTVASFQVLFGGTVAGFALSAALILTIGLPRAEPAAQRPWRDRVTRGMRIYLRTPRLRGLLALNVAVAAAGAMVIVNTVVLVKARLGLGEETVALALAAYGTGSMIAALFVPRLLKRLADRTLMLAGAALLAVGMMLGPMLAAFPALAAAWAILGFGNSLVMTPSGRLLRRSAHSEDRPAIFAAQFALSHACWLVTYPLAGTLGAAAGLDTAFLAMAALAVLGPAAALWLWPADDPEIVLHEHDELPPDHPHLAGGARHAHRYVIDDIHRHWP